jgi:hypothetical protein
MTWTDVPGKSEIVNEYGYRISWAHNKHGTWFNAWTANGKHIDASYDKDKMTTACEAHQVMLEKQRAMRAAEKAAQEIHVEQTS